MTFIARVLFIFLIAVGAAPIASAQPTMNFSDKKEYLIGSCPFVQLKNFNVKNTYQRSDFRLTSEISWKNISSKPLVAFEIVVLYFDPFNRQISAGGRWLITGRNSGSWEPLMPGETSGDGLIGYKVEPVMTAFAFVRRARLSDGTVWEQDDFNISQQMKEKLPNLKDFNFDVKPTNTPN